MDYFFCLFIPHIFIAGSSWTYLEIGWKYEGQNTLHEESAGLQDD